MDTSFCLDALEDALRKGQPEIFNTDQGRNSPAWRLPTSWKPPGCGISMDGRGR
jgi:putative transposase